jgi:hypothetical protein
MISNMHSPNFISLAVSITLLFLFATSEAFTVSPSSSNPSLNKKGGAIRTTSSSATTSASTTSTSLNFFGDAMKNAFGNDDSLGKANNAGLTNVSVIVYYVLYCGTLHIVLYCCNI